MKRRGDSAIRQEHRDKARDGVQKDGPEGKSNDCFRQLRHVPNQRVCAFCAILERFLKRACACDIEAKGNDAERILGEKTMTCLPKQEELSDTPQALADAVMNDLEYSDEDYRILDTLFNTVVKWTENTKWKQQQSK